MVATAERLALGVTMANEAIAGHNQSVVDFVQHKEAAETSIRRHFVVEGRGDYAQAVAELAQASDKLKDEIDSAADLRRKAGELARAASGRTDRLPA